MDFIAQLVQRRREGKGSGSREDRELKQLSVLFSMIKVQGRQLKVPLTVKSS